MKKEKHYLSYQSIRIVLGFIFKVCYRPKIYNKEVIPKEGPIIIAGNHMHLFDQNLVVISTTRMVHYMAKAEYFKDKRKAWFFKITGCIPVDRSIKDDEAKSEAINVLKQKQALGLFPEGTRNKTDDFLLPFKFGAVSLAQKTNAVIIPFAITGEYKIFKKNNLNIRFGKPFKVSENMNLKQANEKLFKEIKILKIEGLKKIENENN